MENIIELESEAIYILRETAAQFSNPAMLFSGGKDSTVLAHLCKKAFWPKPVPFPFLHIDTGHNFSELLDFRNNLAKDLAIEILVGHVQKDIDAGLIEDTFLNTQTRSGSQAFTLMKHINSKNLDGVICGARRNEELSRAKERIFSIRNQAGTWNPNNQRPELWSILNGFLEPGQHMRVFPLSNWTELDVWKYIDQQKIALPSLYYSHKRKCVLKKHGTLHPQSEFVPMAQGDQIVQTQVRCRTVGDLTTTEFLVSSALDAASVISEILSAETSEAGSRPDTKGLEGCVEDKKLKGHF